MVEVHCKEIAQVLNVTPDAVLSLPQACIFVHRYKKTHCCEKCGVKRNGKGLTFHHVNIYTKYFDIGILNHPEKCSFNELPIWSLKKEMNKCELLCPRCHTKKHKKMAYARKGKNNHA